MFNGVSERQSPFVLFMNAVAAARSPRRRARKMTDQILIGQQTKSDKRAIKG